MKISEILFELETKGSGWGNLKKGTKITKISGLKIGDVILEFNKQFNAKNVIVIQKVKSDKISVVFADPHNTQKTRKPSDKEFVIRDSDLISKDVLLFAIKK